MRIICFFLFNSPIKEVITLLINNNTEIRLKFLAGVVFNNQPKKKVQKYSRSINGYENNCQSVRCQGTIFLSFICQFFPKVTDVKSDRFQYARYLTL